MIDQIKALLLGAGIINADATEQDILTAANELVANRRRAAELQTQVGSVTAERDRLQTESANKDTRIGELQTQLTAANEATTKERKRSISLVIEPALKDGRITEAERGVWEQKFGTDFDGTVTAINELDPKVHISDETKGLGSRKGEGAASTITAINEAVAAHQQATGCDYMTAWNAVKRAKPALFEKQAG